jgi:hypothetical protein
MGETWRYLAIAAFVFMLACEPPTTPPPPTPVGATSGLITDNPTCDGPVGRVPPPGEPIFTVNAGGSLNQPRTVCATIRHNQTITPVLCYVEVTVSPEVPPRSYQCTLGPPSPGRGCPGLGVFQSLQRISDTGNADRICLTYVQQAAGSPHVFGMSLHLNPP